MSRSAGDAPVAKQSQRAQAAPALDLDKVRADFPALHQEVHGHRLVYLDSAATSQRPRQVLDAMRRHEERDNANVSRGVHALSARATAAYEGARETVARFLGAPSAHEVVLVRGTTEAINLVAQTLGRATVGAGDEVLITEMEHHSNIVPWQLLCQEKGATLKVAPITDAGALDVAAFRGLLSERTRIASFAHVSNALGTVNPVRELTRLAHDAGAKVLVDGAQAAPHTPVDVQAIGCDLYAVSGHKMYGPTGIGALWGRRDLLEAMPPWQGGGDMIRSVSFEGTTYSPPPHKFEAGTPNIGGAVGLAAACDYLEGLGRARVARHEADVLAYAHERLGDIPEVTIIGTAPEKAGAVSFTLDGVHPHDAGTFLDREGVAVRTGHHCAQPVMRRFNVPATCRASLGVYNGRDDIDALVKAIQKTLEVFA